MKFIVKMVKKLCFAADLGHISRVQSHGPGQQLWLSNILGQAKSHLKPKVRPGLAQLLASGQSWHITKQYVYVKWEKYFPTTFPVKKFTKTNLISL